MNVFAYRPRRGPLQEARPLAAAAFLAAPCVAAFSYDSPPVLAGAGAAVAVAGLAAGAGAALAQALRWGLWLALLVAAVNPLVTSRGLTVLARGPDLPVLGSVDVTLEALAAGGVLGLRILVVTLAFAVYSACVDPDRVLRALRPLARRSALTATLIARMVPLAAADAVRLREAAALRGPGAAPAGRAVLLRRLVAGSLERSVEVAATLELRGYGLLAGRGAGGRARGGGRRSRHDGAFLGAGLAMACLALAARAAGAGGFEAYPLVSIDADAATLALVAALPLLAAVPFLGAGYARAGNARAGRA